MVIGYYTKTVFFHTTYTDTKQIGKMERFSLMFLYWVCNRSHTLPKKAQQKYCIKLGTHTTNAQRKKILHSTHTIDAQKTKVSNKIWLKRMIGCETLSEDIITYFKKDKKIFHTLKSSLLYYIHTIFPKAEIKRNRKIQDNFTDEYKMNKYKRTEYVNALLLGISLLFVLHTTLSCILVK